MKEIRNIVVVVCTVERKVNVMHTYCGRILSFMNIQLM